MKEKMEKAIKEEEKSVLEELREIKAKEEAKKKEDELYTSRWFVIDPGHLIPENLELYKHLRAGTEASLKSGSAEADIVMGKVEQMPKGAKKDSNSEFTKEVTEKIQNAIRDKTLERERAQDNIR